MALDKTKLAYWYPFHWCMDNSILGCGTRTIQGWSAGIGISNTEGPMYLASLLHFSKNQKALPQEMAKKWRDRHPHWKDSCSGCIVPTVADIGGFGTAAISQARWLFLDERFMYIFNSKLDYPHKFRDLIVKYKLGEVSLTHGAPNKYWCNGVNTAGAWNWNGAEIPLDELKQWGVTSYV